MRASLARKEASSCVVRRKKHTPRLVSLVVAVACRTREDQVSHMVPASGIRVVGVGFTVVPTRR